MPLTLLPAPRIQKSIYISEAKHDFFFSFLSGLLYGHKDSNFFKIALEGSDSMKRNFGGFIFKEEAFIAYSNPNTAARTKFNF